VFEIRVLRRIFGPKKEQVAGGCRRLHNVELHNFYSSPNIITVIKSRKIRCMGHTTRLGEMINAYSNIAGKHGRKRPLERPRCRWEILEWVLGKYGGKIRNGRI
jgi:hypothetical protein